MAPVRNIESASFMLLELTYYVITLIPREENVRDM